jgi:trigger factor
MEYTALLELLPQVELKTHKGLTVEIDDFEVSNKKVNEAIQNLLESRAELVPVENRGVRDKDVLILDFQGFLNKRELPEAKADNFVLEMGGPNTMRDFQDGILGMKAGEEREVSVTYPKDYTNAEIAGHKIDYKVKLHDIKAKNYPQLTDEIAKEFKTDGAEDLRKKVRESIEAQAKFDERQQKEERALAALVDANPFQIPRTLIQYQLNNILKELSSMLERQKFSSKLIEEYVNRHIEELHGRAEREVKLALLIPKVVESEKLSATDQEIDQKIELMAQSSDKESDSNKIRAAYSSKEARANIKNQIARDKALELIVGAAKIKVKSA